MTNTIHKKALIAGSTGLVGNEILQQLLSDPQYTEIHVPGRRAPEVSDPRVIFHPTDFMQLDDLPPKGINEVYCALGTTIKKAGSKEQFRQVDFDAVVNLARWAAAADVDHFVVVSSIGAHPKSGTFYLRTKGQMEQVLKTCRLNNLTIVRPALLLGQRQEFRLGETISTWFMKPLQFLLAGPLKKYRPIEAAQVAKA
ncbi:NAD(P)H-binding protein [Geofilum rubicundum]|uniref:Oxidoreductase n=1 Tax=Geofilum rubicundum JCM 15548 TaxID=1236989 RepID=A0A0E9LQ53_9BACT|nr:NAD(P)H-binding protein [Geofilum rubicundum]GAO27742.1 oxidoreductase [Geofilum rubicundum JCM 15548]